MTDYSLKGRAQQRFQELLAYKRKHAPSGKTKTRVHANWFRAQDKKWVASYIKKAAATLDRNKFAKVKKRYPLSCVGGNKIVGRHQRHLIVSFVCGACRR